MKKDCLMFKINYNKFKKNKKKNLQATRDDDSSTSSDEEKEATNMCFTISNDEIYTLPDNNQGERRFCLRILTQR